MYPSQCENAGFNSPPDSTALSTTHPNTSLAPTRLFPEGFFIEYGNIQLKTFEDVLQYEANARITCSSEEYAEIRQAGGQGIAELAALFDAEIGRYYEFHQHDADWETFQQSAEYLEHWAKLVQRKKDSDHNRKSYANAQEVVEKHWGARGLELLEGRKQNFTRKMSQIAKAYPSMSDAIVQLNQATFYRLTHSTGRKIQEVNLTTGDVEYVTRNLLHQPAKQLTDEELKRINSHLSPSGWLQLGPAAEGSLSASALTIEEPRIQPLPDSDMEDQQPLNPRNNHYNLRGYNPAKEATRVNASKLNKQQTEKGQKGEDIQVNENASDGGQVEEENQKEKADQEKDQDEEEDSDNNGSGLDRSQTEEEEEEEESQ
ncbi:hypothetical protein FQN50_009981, partial [Emmonsiellopsis sp. PD_5]